VRRGGGVASVLEALAESTAADVAARREIESDRAKPRSTARWVTLITVSVLGVLALTGDYIAPYGTPIGQMFLVLLLGMYVATLVWMRRMSTGKPLPRFIGSAAKAAAR
jgi:tight adherence protein B